MTARQEEYLMLFAIRNGQDKSVSAAAQFFKVSRPTAYNMSSMLETQGMIHKGTYGEISLTKRGWDYIMPKYQWLSPLATWLEKEIGLPEYLAIQEAQRMAVFLQPQTLSAFIRPRSARVSALTTAKSKQWAIG